MNIYESNFTAMMIKVASPIIQFCQYAWVICDFFQILLRFLENNILQNNITKSQVKA